MKTTASTATTRRRALTLDDLLAVRTPWTQHRIALSPDGRYLAFAARLEARSVESQSVLPSGVRSNVAGSQLWVTDIERGESWPLLGGEGRSWRPSWSPDGTHLAFYADHRGAVQLWSWQPAVGSVEVLSDQALFTTAPWLGHATLESRQLPRVRAFASGALAAGGTPHTDGSPRPDGRANRGRARVTATAVPRPDGTSERNVAASVRRWDR